jgi:hypothetical protein
MRKWWSTSTNLRLKQATLGIETWWEFEDPDKTRPQRKTEMIEFDYLISDFYLEVNVSCFPSFMFEEGNDYVYGSLPFWSFSQVVIEFNKGCFVKCFLFKNILL